jgi:hypothetical protein
MNEDRKKILEMLAEGKISVEEAEKLISALSSSQPGSQEETSGKPTPKYLRILVEPGPSSADRDRVNVRVPLKLVRAGLKFAAFIPKHAQESVDQALHEKGIEVDLAKIKSEDIEEIVTQLNDLTVEVEGKEKVRIYCE